MRRYLLFLLLFLLAIKCVSQHAKSINIHTKSNESGWIYSLDIIDSITYSGDSNFQHIYINENRISHHLAEIDSVSFHGETAPPFNVFLQLNNDSSIYMMSNNGYIKIDVTDGKPTNFNAYVSESPIFSTLNENYELSSLCLDSLKLLFEYSQDSVYVFAAIGGMMIYEGDYYYKKNAKKNLRQSHWNYISFGELVKKIIIDVGEKIKTEIIKHSLYSVLDIALEGNDAFDEFMRKAELRKSVGGFVDLMGTLKKIQDLEDKSATDIFEEMEDLPDLEGLENVIYFAEYVDPFGASSFLKTYILPWIKDIQNNNEKIKKSYEESVNKPTLIHNIKTGDCIKTNKDYAICAVEGSIYGRANAGIIDFDYGICYAINEKPDTTNSVRLNIHLNNHETQTISKGFFTIVDLQPNTQYYYRAFIYNKITRELSYAAETKSFRTLSLKSVPVSISAVTTTASQYRPTDHPQHFIYKDSPYEFKYDVATTVKLTDDEGVENWGYVYEGPYEGDKKSRISLMGAQSEYEDTRFAYYRNGSPSGHTARLYPFVKYTGDDEFYYGEPVDYPLIYPETSTVELTECSTNDVVTHEHVEYNGVTYDYCSTFVLDYNATGAYWITVGAEETGNGWNAWDNNLPARERAKAADGSNRLTINYYYNQKVLEGDYLLRLKGNDEHHNTSCTSSKSVRLTHDGKTFTGCEMIQ